MDNRILSVQQPHIRPIKRGKGGSKNTEFGPKINVSVTEGFTKADQIDFNAFNEANHLIAQIEGYKARFGYYPGRVLADKIYWTRENRKWLTERKINMGALHWARNANVVSTKRNEIVNATTNAVKWRASSARPRSGTG